jgi:predicted metal-binding protein
MPPFPLFDSKNQSPYRMYEKRFLTASFGFVKIKASTHYLIGQQAMMKKNRSIDEVLASLVREAQRIGATDAKAVSTKHITVDDSLTNFCRQGGCENFGLSVNCPPHVSGPAGFQKLITNYDHALVFKIDVPTEILLSIKNRDVFRLLHKIAAGTEKAAIKEGFDKSKAFAGGSCKPLFCQDHSDCPVLSKNAECRHPHLARPSMSGFGVNVSSLMNAAGWRMDRITCDTDPEAVETGRLCGLVLVG